MPHKVRIALDAMGGDHGAAVVVPGAELSLQRHPDIEFLLFFLLGADILITHRIRWRER